MTTHDELRKLAEAATPGPWIEDSENHPDDISIWAGPADDGQFLGNMGTDHVRQLGVTCDVERANARFIAAANPQTILALLDELGQCKAQRDGLLVAAKKANRMYGSLWDSSDGGGFIFPERVKDYDEAFDALNKAVANAEDKV